MKRYLLEDPYQNQYWIEGNFVNLGRSDKNKIVIKDSSISRHHLNFYIQNDDLIVEDAGSQNGFLVNGLYPGKNAVIKHGDEISFGQHTYYVWDADNPERQKTFKNPSSKSFSSAHPHLDLLGSKLKLPAIQNKRILIYGIAGILILFIVLGNKKNKPNEQTINNPHEDEILQALPTDSFKKSLPDSKGPTEVLAESRFREALRDYYNENYSRAIVGLQDSLALNPANEETKSFLSRAEMQLSTQLDSLMVLAANLFQDLHYKKSKSVALEVLTILSEQTPGYVRKLAQENEKIATQNNNLSHEDIMIQLDCNKTQYEKHCNKAIDIIKKSRRMLGEENALK